MDFTLPDHLPGLLAEMDAFIDAEIKPLEREHIQFFDQRRENARTDWDNGGIPRREWEDLLREMERGSPDRHDPAPVSWHRHSPRLVEFLRTLAGRERRRPTPAVPDGRA